MDQSGKTNSETFQLAGGYKSYRHKALVSFKSSFRLVILGGCTGSGKSEILRELRKQGEQIIDLEKLANHKGSAFGGLMQPPQPTSEQFQNDLFEEILQKDWNQTILERTYLAVVEGKVGANSGTIKSYLVENNCFTSLILCNF